MAVTQVPQTGIKNADELIKLADAFGLTVTVETTDRETLTSYVVRIAIPVPPAYAGTELGRAIEGDTFTLLWTKSNRPGARGRLEDATVWTVDSHRKVRTLSRITTHVRLMGHASARYVRETAPQMEDVVEAPHALFIDGARRSSNDLSPDFVRGIVRNRRGAGRPIHQDADGTIVCDYRRYVPLTPENAGTPVEERQHVRSVDGGTPEVISTRAAMDEINHAMTDGKRDVRQMSADRSSAHIVYRDGRSVELRPLDRGQTPDVPERRPTVQELTGPVDDMQLASYAEMYAAVDDGTAIPVRADMVRPGMDVVAAVRLEDRTIATVAHFNGPGARPWVSVTFENDDHRSEGCVYAREHHLMVTVDSLQRLYGAMETTAPADDVKTRRRAEGFAAKWWAERHTEEPTDEALRAVFANCGKQPRPELYPAIREAIAAQMPPAAAAPLFTALAAYEAVSKASLSESPRDLHTLACHLETLPLAAPAGLHEELRAARDDAEAAWEGLRVAEGRVSRAAARDKARTAIERARAVVLAVEPRAKQMRGTYVPATAEEIRAAARAYMATMGTPDERAAIETGTPSVRVDCRPRLKGEHVFVRITAVVDSPMGRIPAHPPVALHIPRRDGRLNAADNARKALDNLFRVEVPVEYAGLRRS